MTDQRRGLHLDELSIRIPLQGENRRWVHAAQRVSLQFEPGRVTAVVGESGCGKSVLALAVMGLLPAGSIVSGAIHDGDVNLLTLPDNVIRQRRGRRIGLIPQSAVTHLNPIRTVGATISETLRYHHADDSTAAIHDILSGVDLPPETAGRYPHELSGGMAQRVLAALTLALEPDCLVADEPTSALDAPTALLVLNRLRRHADNGASVMLITHDIVAARDIADTVAVMYAGRLLEVGPARQVLTAPRHSYSRALLAALPENGLHPAPGAPSSLVDPNPQACAWHDRLGRNCVPVHDMVAASGHRIACASEGEIDACA